MAGHAAVVLWLIYFLPSLGGAMAFRESSWSRKTGRGMHSVEPPNHHLRQSKIAGDVSADSPGKFAVPEWRRG